MVLPEQHNQGPNTLRTQENEFVFKKPPESYSSPTASHPAPPPPPHPLTESITKKHSNLILVDTLHIAGTEFRTLPDQNNKMTRF